MRRRRIFLNAFFPFSPPLSKEVLYEKIAVIVYPHFSLYEVTCLTEALMWFDQPVEIFASSKEPVRSEDGFLITPDKTLDEFSAGDYACVVLPGMMIPFPALFDRKLIDFLASSRAKSC